MVIDSNSRVFVVGAAPDAVRESVQSVWLEATIDLDFGSLTAAAAELDDACGGLGTHRWVLVHGRPGWFVDLRGLMVLIDASQLARRRGRELVVVEPPWSVRRLLDVLGLHGQLRLANTVADLTLLGMPHAR